MAATHAVDANIDGIIMQYIISALPGTGIEMASQSRKELHGD